MSLREQAKSTLLIGSDTISGIDTHLPLPLPLIAGGYFLAGFFSRILSYGFQGKATGARNGRENKGETEERGIVTIHLLHFRHVEAGARGG